MSDIADESPDWSRPASLTLVQPSQAPKPKEAEVFFTRAELEAILSVYGRKVVEGEWRDYAIDALEDRAVFSIFRRASERPLFQIEKRPAAQRTGLYVVATGDGAILRRGQDIEEVLKVLEPRKLRLIGARLSPA